MQPTLKTHKPVDLVSEIDLKAFPLWDTQSTKRELSKKVRFSPWVTDCVFKLPLSPMCASELWLGMQ